MGKIIIFLLPLLLPIYSHANGTQECPKPTSCTPSCGSCCTYYIHKNEEGTVVVKELPFKIELSAVNGNKSNVCEFKEKPLEVLKFEYQGETYKKLEAQVSVKYKSYEQKQNCGPPCPPPPSNP